MVSVFWSTVFRFQDFPCLYKGTVKIGHSDLACAAQLGTLTWASYPGAAQEKMKFCTEGTLDPGHSTEGRCQEGRFSEIKVNDGGPDRHHQMVSVSK
jgi:hypothetical protein